MLVYDLSVLTHVRCHALCIFNGPILRCCAQGKLNSVPVPPRIAQQPGHYSIVGLLPEDHTFSKGMLFLLQPGTKCVIFDVDGVPLPTTTSH